MYSPCRSGNNVGDDEDLMSDGSGTGSGDCNLVSTLLTTVLPDMSSTSTVSVSTVKQKQDTDDLYWCIIMTAIISALALLVGLVLILYRLRRARKRQKDVFPKFENERTEKKNKEMYVSGWRERTMAGHTGPWVTQQPTEDQEETLVQANHDVRVSSTNRSSSENTLHTANNMADLSTIMMKHELAPPTKNVTTATESARNKD